MPEFCTFMELMKGLKHIILLGLFLLIGIGSKAATKTCTLTGDWAVGSTWNGGTVPSQGDSIVIPATKTVNIASSINWDGGGCVATIVIIQGQLMFSDGKKLNLCCGSRVYIYPGGRIENNGNPANSNLIKICGTEYWNSGSGDKNGPGCYAPTDPICVTFLPIELTYFKGEVCHVGNVCLSWSTASEKNNDYFTVERSSDAVEFSEVARITGAGTTYGAKEYTTVDERPLKGLSYYRLKQTDFDKTFTYSPIIAIATDFEINVQNPTHSFDIPLTIKGNKGEVYDVKFIDVLGRVIFHENFSLTNNGDNLFNIDLANKLSYGVVYVIVNNQMKTVQKKVVLE